MAQIEELSANPAPLKAAEQIQGIILFLQRSDDLRQHVDSFMQMLSLVQPKDVASFILTPLLSDELRDVNTMRCQLCSTRCLDFVELKCFVPLNIFLLQELGSTV